MFSPGAEGELVTLHLASRARWVAETTPVDAVRNLDDGSFEVDVRVVQHAWLRHLVLQVADDVLEIRPARIAQEVARGRPCGAAAYGEMDLTVLWFSVWTVLVLATLGGAFLLGRSLWRSAVALGHELSRAADVAAQLAERVDELQAAARRRRDTGPTLFADRAVLRARLDALREAAAGRRAEREQRHVATRLRWQAYWR